MTELYPSSSRVSLRRERVNQSYCLVMKKFVQKFVHESAVQTEFKLPALGTRLGVLIPRLGDSSAVVRQSSAESIQALLYTDQVLRNIGDKRPRAEIKMLSGVRQRLADPAVTVEGILTILQDFASLLSVILPINECIETVATLMKGLSDADEQVSFGYSGIRARNELRYYYYY